MPDAGILEQFGIAVVSVITTVYIPAVEVVIEAVFRGIAPPTFEDQL